MSNRFTTSSRLNPLPVFGLFLLVVHTTAAGWWPFASTMPPTPSCEPTILPLDVHLETDPKLAQAGQEYFLTYHSKSKQSECWSNAFVSINEACSHMHTTAQQELALKFAECFMKDSGRQLHPCVTSGRPVTGCLQQLDASSFSVYTEFFTHLESMCHYIQAEVWQRSAEATIHALSRNAAQAAHTLLKTHTIQETLLEQQQQQLNGYKTLHAQQTALETEIEQSAREIDSKFEGLLQTAHQMSQDLVAQASSLNQIIDFKALYAAGQLEVLEQLQSASEQLDSYVGRVEDMLSQAQQSHTHMEASIGYVERIVSGVTSMWGTVCMSVTLAVWLNIILVCTSTSITRRARTGLILLWFGMLLSEGCDRLLHLHSEETKRATQYALLAFGCVWFASQAFQSCCDQRSTSAEQHYSSVQMFQGDAMTPTSAAAATDAATFVTATPSRSNLCNPNRRKLQMLAKANGIPANLSSDAILEALGGKR